MRTNNTSLQATIRRLYLPLAFIGLALMIGFGVMADRMDLPGWTTIVVVLLVVMSVPLIADKLARARQ